MCRPTLSSGLQQHQSRGKGRPRGQVAPGGGSGGHAWLQQMARGQGRKYATVFGPVPPLMVGSQTATLPTPPRRGGAMRTGWWILIASGDGRRPRLAAQSAGVGPEPDPDPCCPGSREIALARSRRARGCLPRCDRHGPDGAWLRGRGQGHHRRHLRGEPEPSRRASSRTASMPRGRPRSCRWSCAAPSCCGRESPPRTIDREIAAGLMSGTFRLPRRPGHELHDVQRAGAV